MCLATEQVNSTPEIDNSLFADNDHWSGEILRHGTKEAQRVSSCGGVVGADEPMQMGSSSQKRSRGLADGSERGSGQRPKALRDFAFCTIHFHHFFPFFQLGKMSMIGNFCIQLFQSRTRVNPKQWRHKVNCLRLCVNLFSKNKCLFLFLYGNSHWPSQ